MDKKIAGLVGAISALTPMGAMDPAAAKSVAEVLSPASYAELLQPIPNAVALLKTANEMEAAARASQAGESGAQTQLAQYWYHHHHHLQRDNLDDEPYCLTEECSQRHCRCLIQNVPLPKIDAPVAATCS